MNKYFYFWEKIDGYEVPVLNEREVRAGAWILFATALPIFLISCMKMDFYLTKIFIVLFMIDFFIRVCINPKFSPSLIIWRFFVSNQKVEYVWAPQKRFAWAIGLVLSVIMFIMMWIFNLFTLLNMILCILCLVLLFLESSFWICVWCNLYNAFNKEKAKLCPGWVCEIKVKEDIQKISIFQIIIVFCFIIIIFLLSFSKIFSSNSPSPFCQSWCFISWENKNILENKDTISPDLNKHPCLKNKFNF